MVGILATKDSGALHAWLGPRATNGRGPGNQWLEPRKTMFVESGISMFGEQDRCDWGPVRHWMGRRNTMARTQESTGGGPGNQCLGPRKQMFCDPGTNDDTLCPTELRPIRTPLDHRVGRQPPARPSSPLRDPPADPPCRPGRPHDSSPRPARVACTPTRSSSPSCMNHTILVTRHPSTRGTPAPDTPATPAYSRNGNLSVVVDRVVAGSQMRCPKSWDTESSRNEGFSSAIIRSPKNLGHRIWM